MNIHEGIFHLSVNPAGQVSLWDSQRAAMDGKQDGEITVEMALTDEQRAQIVSAKSRARRPKRTCAACGAPFVVIGYMDVYCSSICAGGVK